MVPFERALVSFYRPSIVTLPLSLRVSGKIGKIREKSGKMNYYNYSVAAIITLWISYTFLYKPILSHHRLRGSGGTVLTATA